jgi:hypothetical protein
VRCRRIPDIAVSAGEGSARASCCLTSSPVFNARVGIRGSRPSLEFLPLDLDFVVFPFDFLSAGLVSRARIWRRFTASAYGAAAAPSA